MREWLIALAVALVLGLGFIGFAASMADPHLNLPLLSQVACGVRGGDWYGGGLLGLPGCYTPQTGSEP